MNLIPLQTNPDQKPLLYILASWLRDRDRERDSDRETEKQKKGKEQRKKAWKEHPVCFLIIQWGMKYIQFNNSAPEYKSATPVAFQNSTNFLEKYVSCILYNLLDNVYFK